MTERDKEKIFSKLKEYNSFRDIERNLDYVMDYAETLQDVTDRRKIADDIQKEVKQTIHEWKDGIKKTKYTYPANKLFERLRKINNMKQEEIEELYDELVNDETSPSYVADEVNDETFYETLERMFVEDPKMLDVFNDYVMYNGKDSSQKHRTAYAGIRIKPANALAVLFNHIEKANTIIVMGEQLDLMNKVFNNSNLKRKIENTFGNDITQSFYQHVTANLYSGQSMYRSLMEDFFNKLSNNAVKTQLFFKPQIGLKQLL